MRAAVILVLAGCGRIGFDSSGTAGGACDSATEPISISPGETVDGVLCPGDTDVFALALAGGDEIEATIETDGPGWLGLEITSSTGNVRGVRTLEPTLTAFADRDGTFHVSIDGTAPAAGTPYRLHIVKRTGRYVFLAPNGDDAAAGTFTAPWKRFDTTFGRIAPGDTIVLLDGDYPNTSTGRFYLDCTTRPSGTDVAPLRIAALTPRGALVRSDGGGATMTLQSCSYWSIEGLRVENADNPAATTSDQGMPIRVADSSHITIRGVLARLDNRYVNTDIILLSTTTDSLVEDSEVYDFHRVGVTSYGSQRITIRRVFVASRGRADVVGGYDSVPSDKGDIGIATSHSADAIVESSIDEGNGSFRIEGNYDVDNTNTHVFGAIARGNEYGFIPTIGSGGTHNTVNTLIRDSVAIESMFAGFYVRSNMGFRCEQCTSITAGIGWHADQLSAGPRVSSASCTGCLSVGSAPAFSVQNQDGGWSITGANAFNNGTYVPASAPELTSAMSIDPQLGGCLVYLPPSSPMRGAGPGGTNIGAEVVYRYRDGVLTQRPLWDPQTGAYPCGAVIAGVNDDPATSCIGVHTRLHVGTPDCPLPFPAL